MIRQTRAMPAGRHGFTLLEILMVVALIAILASIIFVAINPARRLAETNNARRWSDAKAILDAVLTYSVDHEGVLPSGIDGIYDSAQVLGTNTLGCESGCGATTTRISCLDLTDSIVKGGYIADIPMDPKTGSSGFTDYYINREPSGSIEVGACDTDIEGTTTPIIRLKR